MRMKSSSSSFQSYSYLFAFFSSKLKYKKKRNDYFTKMDKISLVDHIIDDFQNCCVQRFGIVRSVEIKAVEFGETICHMRSFLDAVKKSRPGIALKNIVLSPVTFDRFQFCHKTFVINCERTQNKSAKRSFA